jgi:hypothetical protein
LTAALFFSLGVATVRSTGVEFHVGTGQTYATIQSAIDAAGADDIVVVHAGTYVEDLGVPSTKAGLEILPATGESVTIKGVQNSLTSEWPLARPNIEINASGVKIHGFTIESPDYESGKYSSGMIIGASNVEVYDNTFNVTPAANADEISQALQTYSNSAIPGVDVSGLNIHDNTFMDIGGAAGYEGIYINLDAGTGTVTMENNYFIGDVCRAMTTERSNTIISGNTVTTDLPPDNPGSGGYQGINIGGVNDGNIADVLVNNNTVGGGAGGFKYGIKLGYTGTSTFTNVNVTDNTIQTNEVGVLVKYSADGVLVNWNNITGNTIYGVSNTDPIPHTLDAQYNWWGSSTGPYHATANPAGTGDEVSDNVDFTPWLMEPLLAHVSGYDSQTVPAGTTMTVGSGALGVSVDVTTTTGTPTVTVMTYETSPGGLVYFAALGQFVDVQINNVSGVSEVFIKVYYSDADLIAAGINNESSLKLYWLNATVWVACSDTGVDTALNYVWARINATTVPNLDQLAGAPFGDGAELLPTGGFLSLVDKFGLLEPYIALAVLAGIALVGVVAIRKKRKN